MSDRLSSAAEELVEAADAFSESVTWRAVAWMQRARSRARGRRWIDGVSQLQRVAAELHRYAARRPLDARHLDALTQQVDQTLDALTRGEIFRTVRGVERVFTTLGAESSGESALDRLRARSEEIRQLRVQWVAFGASTGSPQRGDTTVYSVLRHDDAPTPDTETIVDVIIPVYGARDLTLRCIDSVLASRNRTRFELIVVDDGSRDRGLRRRLDDLSTSGRLTLVRNARNLGFPAAANRGMAIHPDRDVVLLNSDAVVAGDWIDRLRVHARSDSRVATVTPLSNNAEICSYPSPGHAHGMPDTETLRALDTAAARVNEGLTVRIPTAVGFCMLIRRAALQEVGDFDASRFARGYGEENDFCMRARAQGYHHRLAPDVYVAHEGAASFSKQRESAMARAAILMDELHPDYTAEVRAFADADPIRPLRQRLEAALLGVSRPSILMVSHALGGGTESHVRELSRRLEGEDVGVLVLKPEPPGRVSVSRPGSRASMNLVFDPALEFDALVDVLQLLEVRHVHLHHTIDLDDIVRRLPDALSVSYDVTLHDYTVVCPRAHCTDAVGVYCGIPNSESCTHCIRTNGSIVGSSIDARNWREFHARVLAKARRVIVPDQDVVDRLADRLPTERWLVRPHPEPQESHASVRPRDRATRRARGRVRRVAVLGALAAHKGSRVLLACAEDAAKRGLPLEFVLIGHSDVDADLLRTRRVEITGAFEPQELPKLVERAKCELALFPMTCPETYSFTLSSALRLGLFPLAFEIGAVAARIRRLGWGQLIPVDLAPARINDLLLSCDPALAPPTSYGDRIAALGGSYGNYLADYYDDLVL